MFFITSSFTDGGGNLKASKPGKKRKMLSATCWVWSACPISWFLKTWLVLKAVVIRNQSFSPGVGAEDSGRTLVFSGERSGDQSFPTEYEGDTMEN